MMKLYYGLHTCAIGIHFLLEEIGRPYETERIDVSGGATHRPPFSGLNPKGKVPTLVRDDGTVLTEFSAIALWLARSNPEKNLLPTDAEGEARVMEMMAYIEGTIHGQGFGRLIVPQMYEPQDVVHGTLGLGQASVKKQGREMAEEGFATLDPQLGRYEYAFGDSLTIADFALFYVERWAPQFEVALPINAERHLQRLRARPAARKVLELWGEATASELSGEVEAGAVSPASGKQRGPAPKNVTAPLTSVSRLTAAPGKEKLLQETLMSTIATGRAADGNRGFAVHVSKDDPAEFMLVEHWTSEEALATHKREPALLRNMEAMKQQALAKEAPAETHWAELR